MELKAQFCSQTKSKTIHLLECLKDYLFPNFYNRVENKEALLDECKAIFSEIVSDDISTKTQFFDKISEIEELLMNDLQMTYDCDPAADSIDEILMAYPGINAIITHRIAHVLYLLGEKLSARIMSEYAHSLTGIDIHPGATIGHHFFIDHGTGIVIGETTKIGNYVRIYQGVTLGALSLADGHSLQGNKRHPTIGNNVIIYANASILGGDTIIGDNVTIGGNVFITKSIPSNVTVINKDPELVLKNK